MYRATRVWILAALLIAAHIASGSNAMAQEADAGVEGVGARIPKASLQTEDSPLEPGADRETGVEGRVVSRKPKKVLPDAPVVARGDDGKVRNTLTDARGRYKLYLPPGKYTLVSLYDLYNGAEWSDVTVTRGKFRKINFILDRVTDEQVGVDEVEIAYLADTSSETAQLNIR